MRRAHLAIPFVLAAALLALAAPARAQQAELSASTSEIYAGMPFGLTVRASGFAEAPEPQVAGEVAIPGAQVTYVGQTPQVSSMISIVNGRRTDSRSVTFIFQWRVTPGAAGSYTVPAITVQQGATTASTRAAQFTAREVAASPDMKLRLDLPDRPVWVGETFPVHVDWLLRRDPGD
ncbi:MAG TPA: BatD family protein, partial [Planctomycetota bacterium]|nr:BatD family protein [Planctomycetota bacterium]